MEKQRKWQLFLIVMVILLTIYNILPTIFYYAQPLKSPIDASRAEKIVSSITHRTNALEKEAVEWLYSYCDLIQVKPQSIEIDPNNAQCIRVVFAKRDEAKRLQRFLPRAGSLISFAPAQLSLAQLDEESTEVLISRKIPLRLQKEWFSYAAKDDRALLSDRLAHIARSATESSEIHAAFHNVQQNKAHPVQVLFLASQINRIAELFGDKEPLAKRFSMCFLQREGIDKKAAMEALIASFDQLRDALRKEKGACTAEDKVEEKLSLENKEKHILKAETYLKNHLDWFTSSTTYLTKSQITQAIQDNFGLDLAQYSPLFSSLSVDWGKGQIVLQYHPDVHSFRAKGNNEELFEQLIIDETAKIARLTKEEFSPTLEGITTSLHQLANVSGYLLLDQREIARAYVKQAASFIQSVWTPKHPDLQNLKIVTPEEYQTLSPAEQALCFLLVSPLLSEEFSSLGQDAFYMIAKGLDRVAQTYEAFPHSELAKTFQTDLRALTEILYQDGYAGYPGSSVQHRFVQEGDFVFEKPHFAKTLLDATRENFLVRGTQKMALIELSTVEQRILQENKIDTQIHADLLKWKDDYYTAQCSLDTHIRWDTPKPTKSIFWNNVFLSMRKYFRGDERKIIRWGLDLSGGKTVQIELRDGNKNVVTNEADLKQGINELHHRVNKMGVSEVTIRQVGNQIVLDFPGSQALSATELIKASTMTFHVVNEKFSLYNTELAGSVNRFLQEIWNEATVTGRKDAQSIEKIAAKHLHVEKGRRRSEAAQILWDNGLRLVAEEGNSASSIVDESIAKIVLFRGQHASEWHGQSNPLLLVFRNWAIEGADLVNIRAGYDPSKGNYLSFSVRSSAAQDALCAWTSRFSKEKVLGTPFEKYTRGKGWRMAALLNDQVISAPTLDSPLRDSGMISGSFTQREVNQLTADLKAGSLTFTPHILSEKNVSPELGKTDRMKGIAATIAALILVIGSMTLYYRFAGVVASVAVLFNLLILWATLQNLGAALTLAGLAGVILTVGMAVDANVLVFERIKEEFAHSGRLQSALTVGYRKAYSAIIDSNVTTIIAALILLNFDAGPIKSFATNLIIGIASSIFTALFMTRFYFSGWAQNPKNTVLKMADWIRSTRFDFLRYAKGAFALAAVIIVVGCSIVVVKRSAILGMDFTGGYALNLELEAGRENYLPSVEKALIAAGANPTDFQLRELNPAHHIRILFGTSLEQEGKPFYQMPIATEEKSNLRIDWVVDALHNGGISIPAHTLSHLSSHWTAMSGQMSESMRNHSLLGLLISFVCIFIYLAFRFEYKFAAAAIVCLVHDVLITLGCVGLLYLCGVNMQIDLNTIAALMTIIGYSLNDTIIIFDRIREEMRLAPRKPLAEIVNYALNATLSRTTITSGTTMLVLIALVVLGGASIFNFALVMAIGVFLGTLSSWFIASPVMIFFHNKENKQKDSVSLLSQ